MAFKALLLEESGGKVSSEITTLEESALPQGDVIVDVAYSTLNYKDGMVLNGLGRLVRTYPHVPGIDFAGNVAESSSPDFKKGDPVVLTGWGVGEQRWGGYAQKARERDAFRLGRVLFKPLRKREIVQAIETVMAA